MKNNQIVSKLGLAVFFVLTMFSLNTFAEYYVVASAPCAGGCCYSNCYPRTKVIYKKVYHKKYYRPKHHYYRPVRHCYSSSCGYNSCNSCHYNYSCNGCVRPVYPSAWVRGHWNCYGEWVRGHWRNSYYQANYAYPNMIYDPDLSTGDDNPMIDPDMDIDR